MSREFVDAVASGNNLGAEEVFKTSIATSRDLSVIDPGLPFKYFSVSLGISTPSHFKKSIFFNKPDGYDIVEYRS